MLDRRTTQPLSPLFKNYPSFYESQPKKGENYVSTNHFKIP